MSDDDKDKVRECILGAVKDAARDFAHYDREEDSDLPTDAIEEALAKGWITIDEIVAAFRADLVEWAALRDAEPTGADEGDEGDE